MSGSRPKAHSVEQFRARAKRSVPRMVFDFVDGGGGSENTIQSNRAALDAKRLLCSGPVDMSSRSQRVTLFGREYSAPIIIGPTGLVGATRAKGDMLLARAAARENIPFVMATAGTCTMEDVRAVAESGLWMQLYLFQQRELSYQIVEKADRLGFEVLEITIDNPRAGIRLRDIENGFSLPMNWSPSKVADLIRHPGWTWRQAMTGGPRMRLMEAAFANRRADTIAQMFHDQLDPAITWDDIARVRERWRRPLVVKGLLDPQQVSRAVELGVDGIVISNHGGRQLDGAVSTIDILPHMVAQAAGRLTILIDSGFRTGSDIARALALGANGVQLGRAPLYALAADGEQGVVQCIRTLKDELDVAQAMTGASTIADFHPGMIWEASPMSNSR